MKSVKSADGVRIVYTTKGCGAPAIIFIHGGLADRTFWSNQIETFGALYQVVALDLAGHGDSGVDRTAWSLQAFARDVSAVIEAEKINRAVLVGNSMGGPVAAEAALLVPNCVIGIVAVDTFHDFNQKLDAAQMKARAEAFRQDYAGSVRGMVRGLFHPDADPILMSDAEKRMAKTSIATAYGMFESFGAYDMAATVRRLKVPIRCINGDLFPVNFEGNFSVHPDFDAVVLPHTGHYPMLQCPDLFNRHLADILKGWS